MPSLFNLIFFFFGLCNSQETNIYNATADFSLELNPNGNWSFHYSDDTIRDGDYPLLTEVGPLNNGPGGPLVWHSDPDFALAQRPFAGVMTPGNPLGSWANGELAIHPGRSGGDTGPGLVALTFTTDDDATANIDFELAMGLPGNVVWYLEKNDSSQTLASGSLAGNGDSATIDLDDIELAEGETLSLVIDNNGSVGNDLVRVTSAEIELTTEESCFPFKRWRRFLKCLYRF